MIDIKYFKFKFGSSMSQIKKMDGCEEIRLMSAQRHSRQKQCRLKQNPIKSKEVFLTDNQTDQTKSSNEAKSIQIERLELAIRRLERENSQLKQTILKLKATEYYGIDEQKLKNLIRDNQNYRFQVNFMRRQMDKILIEKDFLERNNRVLKEKYEEFTKENSKLMISRRLKTEQSRIKDYELIEDIELFVRESKNQKTRRSLSGEKNRALKKRGKVQDRMNPESQRLRQTNYQTPKLNEDYYILRQVKSNPKKYTNN